MPATKALPKEILPIVDKTTIQFIVEEAKAAGIEDILIVTGKNKRAIENYFDSNPELEQDLEATGKTQLLKLTQDITNLGINLYYTRQPHPAGLGDAIYRARNFVGEEPFVVMLSDDLMKDKVTLFPFTAEMSEESLYFANDQTPPLCFFPKIKSSLVLPS